MKRPNPSIKLLSGKFFFEPNQARSPEALHGQFRSLDSAISRVILPFLRGVIHRRVAVEGFQLVTFVPLGGALKQVDLRSQIFDSASGNIV